MFILKIWISYADRKFTRWTLSLHSYSSSIYMITCSNINSLSTYKIHIFRVNKLHYDCYLFDILTTLLKNFFHTCQNNGKNKKKIIFYLQTIFDPKTNWNLSCTYFWNIFKAFLGNFMKKTNFQRLCRVLNNCKKWTNIHS